MGRSDATSTPLHEFAQVGGRVDLSDEDWSGELRRSCDALLVANDQVATLYLNPTLTPPVISRITVRATMLVRWLREVGPEREGWQKHPQGWQLPLSKH